MLSPTPLLIFLVQFLILTIPFIFLNISISKRKGKNPMMFGLLSVIPLVGMFLSIYLVSLTDFEVLKKLDQIVDK